MNGRKRKIQIKFYVTEEERALIEQKMKLVPNADSKIQITFEDGNTLIGYIECVEYGTYSDENDTLVIRGENGELYILLENRIKDIEELHE